MKNFITTIALLSSISVFANDNDSFDRQVAPILAQRCLSCHSGEKPKGGIDLSHKAAAMQGGESGKAIVAGDLSASLLWQRIAADEMPPKHPLPQAEKTVIRNWLTAGANWGSDPIDPFRYSTDQRAGLDWWSLQPLKKVEPPKPTIPEWERNAIDAFITRRLSQAGLEPNPPADKRTLIRRLTFDLLGLPPTPAQVERFLNDDSHDAYEKLVDRLLESPHYGERWARHWLDVVRFGESNGFEYDQPRDNAWHYRNWVIDSLNADMPYDEFVRLQIAGDLIRPDDLSATAAAGFLVAGAHNTTLPASTKMRMTMAQDELEDIVGVVGQTFLGLTVNCARCHDHKFDPISQKEYYQLAATLAGVQHGERTLKMQPTEAQQRRLADVKQEINSLNLQLKKLTEPIRLKILARRKSQKNAQPTPPAALATWEFDGDLKSSNKTIVTKAIGGARVENGQLVLNGKSAFAQTEPLPFDLGEKTLEVWGQLDNLNQRGGGAMSVQTIGGQVFDAIVFGEREPKKWMAGSNVFARTKPFGGSEEQQAVNEPVHFAIVYQKDGTITGYRNGKPYGKTYNSDALVNYAAGKFQIVFGLRHAPAGGNKMLAATIDRAQLYDRALSADEVAASAGVADANYVSREAILAELTEPQRATHADISARIKALQNENQKLTNTQSQKIYTVTPKNPGVGHVLNRGNVADPGDEVSPAGLKAIAGVDADFDLPPNASDRDRRQLLALWITDHNNPLFARVMMNRLWLYHFGGGLVATPSDFGFNGGKPSHPELLQWLATEFRDRGFRLKEMHRLMVNSATYRQTSAGKTRASKIDADNRLLWRKSPQRLSAESLRDAILATAGKLSDEVGGKGYRDVRHYAYKGSNFYEVIPETGSQPRRRTVYRFSPRGRGNPFLNTFDCPDPSTTAPKRPSTTTPLQALALMNNVLVFEMADAFAKRVESIVGNDIDKQINQVSLLAYNRPADSNEVELAREFVARFGLAAYCRLVFNSNEFLFVQ